MSQCKNDSVVNSNLAKIIYRLVLYGGMALLPLLIVYRAANAQILTTPSWVGSLLLGNSAITADPTMTAPEAQGLGRKFELLYAMMNDQDPLNSDNDVISVVTTTAYPAGIGVAVRDMLPGATVPSLTDQINIKYYFPGAPARTTCSGGSPRIQLLIDPGDGTGPRNAFGYIGHAAFGAGCITAKWDFVDLSNLNDPTPYWDLSQFLASGHPVVCDMTCSWAQVVAFFNTATFPNQQVLSGGVYDDSCSFDAAACAKAYYDLLTIENRTLTNREDTVQGPTQ